MKDFYIVTGGAGLIGSNIVRALNQRGEENILVVDHLTHPGKEANLKREKYASYMERDTFRTALRAGEIPVPKTIFHLGACSSTTEMNEAYLDDNNTGYTRELCQWALAHGSRFLYASSAATYGDGELGYNDADDAITRALQPLNLYGWSKQKFDLWAMDNGVMNQIVGLKFFNVFGPGEDHKGTMRSVVHKAYEQICETGKLQLFRSHRPDYQDGCQDRDFVYVKDAARIMLFFHDHPEANGLFNCGTGHARTWLDLGRAVFRAMDREPAIEFVDMPETLRARYQYHTLATTEKLRAVGCEPASTPLEVAVDDYVRNYLAR